MLLAMGLRVEIKPCLLERIIIALTERTKLPVG